MTTNHRGGKDPTPQGRLPEMHHVAEHPAPERPEEARYVNSAPGPAVRKDGAWFFAYKNEGGAEDAGEAPTKG